MKNKLLSCMCLAAVLGLGACGGTNNINISNKRLKENEELIVYASDFKYGDQYYLYLTARYTKNDTVIVEDGCGGGLDKYENSYLEYSIKSNYASFNVKTKTTNELTANYEITCSNLSYYVVSSTY